MHAAPPADCPCRRRRRMALNSGAGSATMPAQDTTMAQAPQHSASEWVVAGGVVLAGGAIGAIIGAQFKHPWVGLILGLAGGLAFNWLTGCPVCRDHAASMGAT